MMDKVELGIEFERRFRQNLWSILENISDKSMYPPDTPCILGEHQNSVLLFPESGRQAAKDGHKVGDIIINGNGYTCFVDCTSAYARSDNRLKTRVRTATKDLAEFYEYMKMLNTYHPSAGPYKSVDKKTVKGYENVRSTLFNYLDNTFGYTNKPIIECEGFDSELLDSYYDNASDRFNQIEFISDHNPEGCIAIHYDTAPWHMANSEHRTHRFYGAIAFEYANDIFVTLLSDATLPALNKSDPSVAELLPLSFTLAGFAMFLYDDCANYAGVGELEFRFSDILDKLKSGCGGECDVCV